MVEDVIARTEHDRRAKILRENDDGEAGGDVVEREDVLGRDVGDLKGAASAEAIEQLIPDPLRRSSVNFQRSNEPRSDAGQDNTEIYVRNIESELGDKTTSQRDAEHIREDERNARDTRGRRGEVVNGLEVYGEEVDKEEECGVEAEYEEARGPDRALENDSRGYGRVVAEAGLDDDEGEKEEARYGEEGNDAA